MPRSKEKNGIFYEKFYYYRNLYLSNFRYFDNPFRYDERIRHFFKDILSEKKSFDAFRRSRLELGHAFSL
jgi:hypothetical protein